MIRTSWSFAPGMLLSFSTRFQNIEGPISSVLPSGGFLTIGTGVDFSYVTGEEGGFLITGGLLNGQDESNLFDKRWVHARYKLFGAGMLSGAGGTMGNGYVGLDNSLSIGAAFFNSSEGLSGAGDKSQWGLDLESSYGNLMAGVAYGQNSDLDENLLHVEAAYFIYPWLVAQVDFDDNSADDATSEFGIEASIGF